MGWILYCGLKTVNHLNLEVGRPVATLKLVQRKNHMTVYLVAKEY